jgi:hypothetical protein
MNTQISLHFFAVSLEAGSPEPKSMGGGPSEGPKMDVFQHLPQQHMDYFRGRMLLIFWRALFF